jgi:hypothetical protein
MKSQICGHCTKLVAGTSGAVSTAHKGVFIFDFLLSLWSNNIQSYSLEFSEPATSSRSLSSAEIFDRGVEIHQGASKHRLNQPSRHQNPSLQAAESKKQNLSTLKKQTKGNTVEVKTSLNYFPVKGGDSKKVAFDLG